MVVNENPTEQDRQRVLKALTSGSYEHVMYGAFVRVISYKEEAGPSPADNSN